MSGLWGGDATYSTKEQRMLSLRIQQSTQGLVIAVVYGKTRVTGNLIWFGDFKTWEHTTTSSPDSGKGGSNQVVTQNTHYTYTAALVMALCEGPIDKITKIWKDKGQCTHNALSHFNLTLHTGRLGQLPPSFLSAKFPQEALGYSDTAYVASARYDLTTEASAGNHNFEVVAKYPYSETMPDANPRDILFDLLTNKRYGVGFDAACIGNLDAYTDYCRAQGIFLSPAYTEQKSASERFAQLMRLTHSSFFWSDGLLKVVPYADNPVVGNGVIYIPNVTPIYDLTDHDFQGSAGSDAVTCVRKTPADAFNQVQVEYQDRENDYNVSIAEAKDEANIQAFGARAMPPVKMHEICTKNTARRVAQLLMQRSLYVRNTYQFRLSCRFALLEPMDMVTLTDVGLGLDKTLVRITKIEEDDQDLLHVEAEDCLIGIGTSEQYPVETAQGYLPNSNVDPGAITEPFIFEMPNLSATAQVRLSIAVTGQTENWGGCVVYTALDGETYQRSGIIFGGALYGNATSILDDHQTFDVALAGVGGELYSVSQSACQAMQTLCYVGGEYIGYEIVDMRGKNQYRLTTPLRSIYGTDEVVHQKGEPFVCINNKLYKSLPLAEHLIGKTIYFKFVSFNVFGSSGEQTLENAQAYTYQVVGSGFLGTLPLVPDLTHYFKEGRLWLTWGIVTDARLLDYEVRKGERWATAQKLTRTRSNELPVVGDGQYFVSARSAQFYSTRPSAITITGSSRLTSNVVFTQDFNHPNWSPCLMEASLFSHTQGLVLAGDMLFSSIPKFSLLKSVVFAGRIMPSGIIACNNPLDLGSVQDCFMTILYTLTAYLAPSSIQLASVDETSDLTNQCAAEVEVSYGKTNDLENAQNNPESVYHTWQPFLTGTYRCRYLAWRIKLKSFAANVTPVLSRLAVTADMPDRLERGEVSTSTSDEVAVLFSRPFTKPPTVLCALINETNYQYSVYTSQVTTHGFQVSVRYNSHTRSAKAIHWMAQGF